MREDIPDGFGLAQHLDELGVPVFKALDQGLVLCKPDKVIDAEFITEVNECGIAESRVCTEQNHGVGPFRPDALDQGRSTSSMPCGHCEPSGRVVGKPRPERWC